MSNRLFLKENMVNLRQLKGWTQQQLAEELDSSQSTIQRWESGDGEPSISITEKMASLYGVSIDTFLHLNLSIKKYEQEDKIAFLRLLASGNDDFLHMLDRKTLTAILIEKLIYDADRSFDALAVYLYKKAGDLGSQRAYFLALDKLKEIDRTGGDDYGAPPFDCDDIIDCLESYDYKIGEPVKILDQHKPIPYDMFIEMISENPIPLENLEARIADHTIPPIPFKDIEELIAKGLVIKESSISDNP